MRREVRPPISAHDPVVGAFNGDHFLPQVEQGRFAWLAFLLSRLHDFGMGVLSAVSLHLHHLRCSTPRRIETTLSWTQVLPRMSLAAATIPEWGTAVLNANGAASTLSQIRLPRATTTRVAAMVAATAALTAASTAVANRPDRFRPESRSRTSSISAKTTA